MMVKSHWQGHVINGLALFSRAIPCNLMTNVEVLKCPRMDFIEVVYFSKMIFSCFFGATYLVYVDEAN